MVRVDYLLLIAFAISSAGGHTTNTNVIINGVTRTDCLRPTYDDRYYSQTGVGSTYPMADSSVFPNGIEGENYTCGWMPFASTAAKAVCPVQAGQTIQVTFYNVIENQPIAENHRGAIIFYMNKYSGVGGVPTAGWFKIFESGILQKAASVDDYKWASPWTLYADNGKVSVTIPSDIAPGKYLLRTEVLAVFDISPRGPQPYVRCVELDVTGSGTINPPGINIPGTMKYTDPGLSGVWWRDYVDSYPFPGPAVYRAGSIATPPPAPVTTRAVTSAAVTSAAVTSGPVTSNAVTSNAVTSGALTTSVQQGSETSATETPGFCADDSCEVPNSECVNGYCVCKSGYVVNGLQCIELEGSIVTDSSGSSVLHLFGALCFLLVLLL
eukprot:TRINITY_DN993_c0_g2_i2.p1 TRINITY_DN993_c0_g2~~TRINITY_DN993_c0_g2_i2.p1  ORF type:complete len:382 (+),score=79.22 TRINITY_DN993_c0_g2_i2:35-1180(+)